MAKLKPNIILLSLAFISTSILAQNRTSADMETQLLSFISKQKIKNHVYSLASQKMGGRLYASPEEKKAAVYIKKKFRQAGLRPGANGKWQQIIKLFEDSVVEAKISIGTYHFKLGTDFSYNRYNIRELKNIFITDEEVIFVKHGIQNDTLDDYKNLNVKNKIVMAFNGSSNDKYGYGFNYIDKVEIASRNGAKLILIIDDFRVADLFDRREQKLNQTFTYRLTN